MKFKHQLILRTEISIPEDEPDHSAQKELVEYLHEKYLAGEALALKVVINESSVGINAYGNMTGLFSFAGIDYD